MGETEYAAAIPSTAATMTRWREAEEEDLTRTVTVHTRIMDGNYVVRFLQKLQPVEAAVSPTPPPRHP
ncbi:hypothetical protein HanRHA438_Chr16g0739591 [Helianthus annuus]|nr:hypothetical protein HanHA300_Chr16g0592801 [Helianthus annuus]KAJ0440813.1 hypothetical protein HanIR_Chr16g0790841 [Helianthus annuus]KAJ0458901.1 hypothetical protein HanHA89_Chr16g0642961 [Helianthus annuus]KAJ0639453.1 hypothetical protein HanLR1_Chr16g0604061 [Helianthus annuus]KAJ0643439.1 hypothetical protein HanOQP8_Chr16g0600561 [Helianthus annuus]